MHCYRRFIPNDNLWLWYFFHVWFYESQLAISKHTYCLFIIPFIALISNYINSICYEAWVNDIILCRWMYDWEIFMMRWLALCLHKHLACALSDCLSCFFCSWVCSSQERRRKRDNAMEAKGLTKGAMWKENEVRVLVEAQGLLCPGNKLIMVLPRVWTHDLGRHHYIRPNHLSSLKEPVCETLCQI